MVNEITGVASRGARSPLRYRENILFQKLGIFLLHCSGASKWLTLSHSFKLKRLRQEFLSILLDLFAVIPPSIVTTSMTVADLGKTEKVCQKLKNNTNTQQLFSFFLRVGGNSNSIT